MTATERFSSQVSGGDRQVRGGQGAQEPVPGVQTEEVSRDGHEQGR